MKPASSVPEDDPSSPGAAHETQLPALAWVRRARAEDELLLEVARRIRRRRRLTAAVGSVAGIALAGILWLSWGLRPETVRPSPGMTATISLPQKQILPDGSIAEMKGNAQIEVDYSGIFRRVVLRQGEAHFEVMKNARPFVVEAAGIKVRAVGTAFSVQLGAAEVEVLVTEGEVRVAPRSLESSAAHGAPQVQPTEGESAKSVEPILRAGDRGIMSLDAAVPRIDTLSDSDLAARLSWRVPNLEFSRTPLGEVVELMNRHAAGRHRIRFVIESPELGEVKLSGFLRTDNSEGLVRLLEKDFGVETRRSGDVITLRKAR